MKQNPHNVLTLKNSNRALILECIRRSPISRADISRRIGLSKSAVTMLTAEMIEEGLLREAGLAERTPELGRTSILMDLVPDYAFAVGVTRHRRHIGVCATDLKAQALFRVRQSIDAFQQADEAVDWIADTVREELSRHGLSWERCVGIGISSPGPLDYRSGVILEPPGLPMFRHYPIAARLRERFDCPVQLENNAVALAMLDFYRLGGAEGNELFVVVADGIGSALLMDGRVFRGAQGFAGELGHISIDPAGRRCSCGNRGCLEQYATLAALWERFSLTGYDTVAELAARGTEQACEVLDYLAERLGTALVTGVNLYDLDTVVMYGEYAYRGELLNRRLHRYIREHSLTYQVHPVAVVSSALSLEDRDLASAVSALNNFFANNWNR